MGALTVAAVALALAVTGCSAETDEQAAGRSATPMPSTDASPRRHAQSLERQHGRGDGQPDEAGDVRPGGPRRQVGLGRYEFEPFLKTMSGADLLRGDVVRRRGEPGARDWSTLDRIADRSQKVGVTMMLKLRVGRCWATGGEAQYERGRKTESAMPKDMGTYRAWVRDAVLRYSAKGIHEYAIENEINSKSFWAGTPQEFATLAETAAKEIRAADRNALVVDAGLSSTTYGYGLSKWLLEQGREADAITAYNRYYGVSGRAATRSWRSATVPGSSRHSPPSRVRATSPTSHS